LWHQTDWLTQKAAWQPFGLKNGERGQILILRFVYLFMFFVQKF
jgi:hypothetical protein